MKGNKVLRLGDTVLWRGDPPQEDFTQAAVVAGIEQGAADDFNHTGVEMEHLDWQDVKDAIVIFADNSWEYGYHIRPEAHGVLAPVSGASEETPRPVESATAPSSADNRQHIDFLQGLLAYNWETTPDDSEDRKAFLHQIEQAQAWLQGMEDAEVLTTAMR